MWKREKAEPIDRLEEVMTDPATSMPLHQRQVVQPSASSVAAALDRTGAPTSSASSSPSMPATQKCSTLGATLRFKGDLVADEDLVIQGQVEGSILHTRSVTIGAHGRVQGDTRARRIVVEGTIDGSLYALESVTIRAGAVVRGDVFAPRVSVDEGARLSGRIDMDNAPAVPSVRMQLSGSTSTDTGELSDREVDAVLSQADAARDGTGG